MSSPPIDIGPAREMDRALMIADLSGYTALTESPVAVFELTRANERRAAVAIDPVCRMQVVVERAGATVVQGGKPYYFCSPECERKFVDAPQIYAGTLDAPGGRTGSND